MRALSIRQPWAWMIVHGGKNIENRSWNTKFRGRFLIHASATCTRWEYEHALDCAFEVFPHLRSFAVPDSEELGFGFSMFIPPLKDLQLGAIIGSAVITGVREPYAPHSPQWQHDWHVPEQYGIELVDARPLPVYPCKGSLGWWGDFQIRRGRVVQL